MILEIVQIDIVPDSHAAFEAAVAEAAPLFQGSPGCRSFSLHRSHEHPDRYRLFVGWDRIEDHVETFRNSPAFGQWRILAGPFFVNPPHVEHVEQVMKAF